VNIYIYVESGIVQGIFTDYKEPVDVKAYVMDADVMEEGGPSMSAEWVLPVSMMDETQAEMMKQYFEERRV